VRYVPHQYCYFSSIICIVFHHVPMSHFEPLNVWLQNYPLIRQVPNFTIFGFVTFSYINSVPVKKHTIEQSDVFSSKYFLLQYFKMNCPLQFQHKCTVAHTGELCGRYKGCLVGTQPRAGGLLPWSPRHFCTTFSESCQMPGKVCMTCKNDEQSFLW
jgi:hypothetical protein